jgi:6-phosphogluconolactonase
MSSRPTVLVHRDPALLADAAAARLVTRLVDAQAAAGTASLVLTGGTIGIELLRHLDESPARDAIDWRRLDVWWGDERFLPSDDPDRNDTQAREALLDRVDLDPARVHAWASSDGVDPEGAAELYAAGLGTAARPEDHGPVPTFDVCLLGVGPDGHVASLFPEMPAVYETTRTAVAVRGSPKPPPIRLTLTLTALNAAREVWFVVAGEDKARAVRMALSGAGPVAVPAAGVRGRSRTLWLLDTAAASQLPQGLARLASP